jgi:hypothetical protein
LWLPLRGGQDPVPEEGSDRPMPTQGERAAGSGEHD